MEKCFAESTPCINSPIPTFICNGQGFIVAYNQALVDLWGHEPLLGIEQWHQCYKMYSTEKTPIPAKDNLVERAISTQKSSPREEVIIELPNGQIKNLWIYADPFFETDGQFSGVTVTQIDITELKSNDTRQAMLAAIIRFTRDAIISKNINGIITSWNQAAVKMFGYTENEAIGKHISLIIPEDRLSEEDIIIDKIRRGTSLEHFETVRVTKSGKLIPISLTVSPIRNSRGEVIGASKIARDITEQKLAEERLQHYASNLEDLAADRTKSLNKTILALQKAQKRLNQSLQKEKELGLLKSRFVSMASHEFRTPLSTIQLSASLIERHAQPSAHGLINKHIGKIKNAVINLTGILNDFLSLDKLDSGKVELMYEAFDLVEFSEDITDEMQPLTKPGQSIIYQHTGLKNMIQLDKTLLKGCVTNILSNAIKYSGDEALIEFDTLITDTRISLTIKDNGIGIPKADQKHLFEAFFRAHNTGNIPGTGLGLNIIARHIRLMNGQVNFKSELNQGTFFTISFPVVQHE